MQKSFVSSNEKLILKLINEHGARRDLDFLVGRRAQRHTLIDMLANLHFYSPASECFEALTPSGLSRREVMKELKKIDPAIQSIQRILPLAVAEPISLDMEDRFGELPSRLAQFRQHIRLILKKNTFKYPPEWNHLLAMLVGYVKLGTGNHYDEQVSSLVSAVTSFQRYDAPSLKQWRHRNKALLESVVKSTPSNSR
jgi:hypothetical protein